MGGGVSGLQAEARSTSRFGAKDEMSHDSNFEVSNEDEAAGFDTVTFGTLEIDVFDEVNGYGLGERRYGIAQFWLVGMFPMWFPIHILYWDCGLGVFDWSIPGFVGVIQLSGMFSMGMFDVTSLEKPPVNEVKGLEFNQ